MTAFSDEVFSSIRRVDQRRWAQAYLSGLLITPGHKSVRRLAHYVSTSPTAAQSLRQFVSTSPWGWDSVMRKLTRWAERYRPASAWTIHRVVIPKSGEQSVGVHRYFDPLASRTLNCQLGIGAFLAIGAVQVPVDWRLHLPAPWAEDGQLRRRARIPDTVRYRPVGAQMLDIVDTLASRTERPRVPIVTDLSDALDADFLLRGLDRRNRDFVVALPPYLKVHPTGEGALPGRGLVGAGDCVSAARAVDTVTVTMPDTRQRPAQARSALVRLPGGRAAGPPLGPFRLVREVGADAAAGPVWITNLTEAPLDDVLSLAALRASAAASIDTLKQDFGLGDFEGRSFPGWYHHMTLVSSAYAYQHLASAA
ncbi:MULTISPECIES: IS701 family transposase [Streptomyces]|uniref:IS701 family transposase n=1 Tax=Streptomyces TaxID=1883 RepID=UPI001E64AC49|nr:MULTISPECIES: transposase [Streptomyces]UFQ20400.1 transposase [Streptomyces huasconensis]WCL90009.1 transposase [Streptomyces sp. JCM 35825]